MTADTAFASVREWLDQEIVGKRLAAGYCIALRTGSGIRLDLQSGGPSFQGKPIPYDIKARFNLGSTTKPFTATLILKTCEEFGVHLEDPVKKYVPEYPFDDVTLLMIMTHTAGFSPFGREGIPLRTTYGRPNATEYLQTLYQIREKDYTPGSKAMYFSSGYTILMDVIERVTGGSIEQYARSRLFSPLEMNDSTYEIRSLKPHQPPFPTMFAPDGKESPESKWNDLPALGEGNMTSTCADLMQFGMMIVNSGHANGREILGKESVHRSINDATGGRFYHTGVFMCRGKGTEHPTCFSDEYSANAIAHAGFCGTMLWIEPALDMTAAILTNSTRVGQEWYSGRGNLMWRISKVLRNMALGQHDPLG